MTSFLFLGELTLSGFWSCRL